MNSFIYFSSLLDEIIEQGADIIGGIFNIVWSLLCSIIYGLIVIMFNIFNGLTQIDLLSTDKISGIYQRLTMVVTIVMVFYITFAFVKYIVSPDTVTDKEKGAGKTVGRIIIAILLIAFVPTIFTTAKELQVRIINTNVISRVIFGQENWDYTSAGSNFVGDIFAAFYRVNRSNCDTPADCEKAQAKVDSVIQKWKNGIGSVGLLEANGREWIDFDNTIQFDGLLAVIFGAFMLYVLFSYNLDIVTRYLQLIFLQIMAPIAIISSIAPQKDNMLKKWSKQCITTYLDIFIRIAILYFMILIMQVLSSSLDFYEMSKNGEQIGIFTHLMIICGLLIFVHRAPKLIKELFPSLEGSASIGFGFNAKDRIEPIKKSIDTIKKPIAATAGAVAGVARTATAIKTGKLTSNIKGNRFQDKLKRGLTKGWSAAKAGYKGAAAGAKNGRFSEATAAARQSVQKDEVLVNNSGTILGHDFRGGRYQDIKAGIKLKIENLEAITKAKDSVSNAAKEIKVMKTANSYKEEWIQRGIGDPSAREKAIKDIEKATRVYAVSDRNDAATRTTYENAIKEALTKVYGNDTAARDIVLQNLTSTIAKDNNWDKLKLEIEEAQRISIGQKYEEKDDKGNVIAKREVQEGPQHLKEFAKDIGDVSDYATTEKREKELSEETRKANANASEGQK